MKLYSRGQLLVVAGVSCLVLVLFAFGVGLFQLPQNRRSSSGASSGEAVPAAAPVAAESGPVLQQSASARRLLRTAADVVPYDSDEQENISVYDDLNEAVVNITTETVALNWFLEPVPQDGNTGSGSIIDTRGYVLTNNHVIAKATKVYINLADGSQLEGTVVGTDPENDLAVLKFDPPKGVELRTVPFGDSSAIKVGQKVLAIGNPFGFERTLTVGIVSGVGRPIRTSNRNVIKDMIQTDASINPGNSGGPLLDSRGRMIGINTMIYSPSGGSVGIGLAIPVNTAKRVVSELIEYGKVRRGDIDAVLVQLFPALVNFAKLPVDKGLLVSRTTRGGQAEKAGLRQGTEAARYGTHTIYLGGDIITKVDGLKVDTLVDYYSALEDNKPGETVDVEVMRGGKKVQLKITLVNREETTA